MIDCSLLSRILILESESADFACINMKSFDLLNTSHLLFLILKYLQLCFHTANSCPFCYQNDPQSVIFHFSFFFFFLKKGYTVFCTNLEQPNGKSSLWNWIIWKTFASEICEIHQPIVPIASQVASRSLFKLSKRETKQNQFSPFRFQAQKRELLHNHEHQSLETKEEATSDIAQRESDETPHYKTTPSK